MKFVLKVNEERWHDMMKSEFDALSVEAGFGPCAPNMYDEIEMVYMEVGSLSKEDMVQLYWKHTGVYETLVQLAHAKKAIAFLANRNRREISDAVAAAFGRGAAQ